MIDLANIQQDTSKKYLSLEHLRAIIYQEKCKKGKNTEKNEKYFSNSTCAKDVLLLLKNYLEKGEKITCYKQDKVKQIPRETTFDDLEGYLEFLVFLSDEKSHNYNYFLQTHYEIECENRSQKYINVEYLFVKREIESIINHIIPDTSNLIEDELDDLISYVKVKEIDLTPIVQNRLDGYSSDELRQQIERLESELIEKDNIITKMQLEVSEKRTAKSSAKSENKKNAFIKSLLKIHYGEEVAENPRAHIYDPNMSEKSRDGKIQKDFELHGLTKHLPTGKTLKNWVDSVELDN